jgi:hypothetical protein
VKLHVFLSTLAAFTLLTACAHSTRPSKENLSPLVTASCPKLTPLLDDSFGATTLKLLEVTHTYYECRRAAGVTDEVSGSTPR